MQNEKFDYFMQRTEKDLDFIKHRIDQLWTFRLMLLGGAAVVSALVALITAILIGK